MYFSFNIIDETVVKQQMLKLWVGNVMLVTVDKRLLELFGFN